jgi:cytochrome c oxidase subunit 2
MTPMMSMFLRFLLALLLFVVLWSLADFAMAANPVPEAVHSALDAVGPQSAHFVDLWRIFLGLCSIVFALVVLATLYAVWRAPRADAATAPDLSGVNAPEPGPRRHVTRAVVASVLGLLALIVASVFTDRALARLSLADAVNIDVTAHQWWWTVRYNGQQPSDIFTTANEIHIPVGRPVLVRLNADDVIHSFWVPNLGGKKDLIPGRTSTLQLRADKPGIYRGQCAEFCGFQHAQMAFLVIAEPPDQYEAWVQAQKQTPPQPADPTAQRGRQLFQSMSCAKCHAVQGTHANGQRAPDLTHVASRRTLAAGALPNTPQDLGSWIRNPQVHKPGTTMPATPMSQQDLDALVAYLGGLK